MLYRQGDMKVMVNADHASWSSADAEQGATLLSAIALSVRNAAPPKVDNHAAACAIGRHFAPHGARR